MKCGKCNEDFSCVEIAAKCTVCQQSFHPACTRLGSTQNFTKSKKNTWKCDSCKGESSSIQSSNEDIAEEKKTILDAINAMKNEILSSFDCKIETVQSSVDSMCKEMKSLKEKLSKSTEEQEALKKRCLKLELCNNELTHVVQELHRQVRDMDQHSRSANLEVQGLPKTEGENLYELLKNVAAAINVPFNSEEISICHRLRMFSNKLAHPPLIIQFTSRNVREAWLMAARRKKRLSTSDISPSLQPGVVYINEHLTFHNKRLLGYAKRLVREKRIHFATYSNGKVLIKEKEGGSMVRIYQMDDIDKFDS